MSDEQEKTSIMPSDTFKQRMEQAKTNPAALILLMGPINQVGKIWKLTKPSMRIGRLSDQDIFIDDRSMSRKHAEIRVLEEKVFVEDLGSSNGTEVSGEKLAPGNPVQLKDNDQIKLGNVIFKFLAEGNIEAVAGAETLNRALTDPLTQIHNKLAFLEKVDEIFKKSKQTSTALSLIVFDLDKFKNVNDTYGHQAGDFVLKELSSVIKQKLRPSDFFSRYGGEEFTILINGSVKTAYDLAERLRGAVEQHDFHFEGQVLPVTISAGVAELQAKHSKWEELFEEADKASYASKQNGRNQVTKA